MTPSFAVLALWGLFIISWIVAAAWVGKVAAMLPVGPQQPLYAGGAVAVVALAAISAGVPLVHVRLWPENAVFDWLMVALCATGFGFCWWARVHIGSLWSAGIDAKSDHRVVDTGPYGIVRHPIYTGVIVAAIAFAAVRARPMAMLLALFIAVFFGLKAKLEETFLREQLGDAYDAYKTKVGMLVPFLK